MAKIDEKITILPDMEMYGGNNEEWVIQLYNSDGTRCAYDDLHSQTCTFTLIIKDFRYAHRSNGATNFSLVKTGTLDRDNDGVSAVAKFTLVTSDTLSVYGKYIYQVDVVCSGVTQSAQGNLYITKNINQ